MNLALTPAVFLPDGTELKTWKDTTTYRHSYWASTYHQQAARSEPRVIPGPFILQEPGQGILTVKPPAVE